MSRTDAIRELFRRAADDPEIAPLVWRFKEPDKGKLDLTPRRLVILPWTQRHERTSER